MSLHNPMLIFKDGVMFDLRPFKTSNCAQELLLIPIYRTKGILYVKEAEDILNKAVLSEMLHHLRFKEIN